MKIKTIISTFTLILFLICESSQSYSQTTPDIPKLTNKGNLPSEFLIPASVKYEADIKRMDQRERKAKRLKAKKDFYLKSNYLVDELLKNGKVVFELEYSTYIRRIIEIILKKDPDLAKKIKVYLIKSSAVNAFATQDGSIFITVGLLTQVENEAQLAYILSHEIVHINNRHALAIALESERLKDDTRRDKSLLKDKDSESMSIKKHRFSQAQELEADNEGLRLYAETGYSLEVIDQVFDVLHYSFSPYDEIVFDKQYFNSSSIKISESNFLDIIPPLKAEVENSNDDKSTHPNTYRRRIQAKELLKNYKSNSIEKYLVSETRFRTMQRAMRFELPNIQLHYEMYQDAIYNAFLLKKTYKVDKYADVITLKALYGLAKYKSQDSKYLNGGAIKANSVQGESRQVYHFLEKLNAKQTAILALSQVWRASKLYKEDSIFNIYADDLLWVLIDKHNATLEEFKPFLEPSSIDSTNATVSNSIEKTDSLTKLDKIRNQQKQNGTTSTYNWWEYALSDAIKDSTFVMKFKEYAEVKKYSNEHEDDLNKKLNKNRAKQLKKGAYLGIPRIVLVNPNTFTTTPTLVYNRKKKNFNYEIIPEFIKSEKDQKRFLDLNIANAQIAGLDLVPLGTVDLKAQESDKFNDITLLNEWFYEQNSAGTMPIMGVKQDEILKLADKYNTDYFLWTGYYYENAPASGLRKSFGVFFYFFTLGITGNHVLDMIRGDSHLVYYSILYNVRTGKNEIIKFSDFEKNDLNTNLNAHIYDTFLQIKTTKKSKK